MIKPDTYNPPWPIDSALFEEGKARGRLVASRETLHTDEIAELSYLQADAHPRGPWKLATCREDWAAGFREGYAEASKRKVEREIVTDTRGVPTHERLKVTVAGGTTTGTRGLALSTCPICRKPAHAGETDESGAHPACAARPRFFDAKPVPVPASASYAQAEGRRERPRLTLDSTVREVMGVLEGVVGPVEVRKIEAPEATRRFETSEARGVHVGWEASCSIVVPSPCPNGEACPEAFAHTTGRRRLSALAPTHLEALVALANVVVGEG